MNTEGMPEWYASELAQLKEDRRNGDISRETYTRLKRQLDYDANRVQYLEAMRGAGRLP